MDRLTTMEVLVAIVDQGGFGRAAKRLGMSPTMVSTHVARLEDRLGTRLIHRNTRRFALTPQGHLFVEEARAILETIARAKNSVRRGGGGPSGRVSIDVPGAIGLRFVVPMMQPFRERQPGIALDLNLGERASVFRPEGGDLLICVGVPPEGKGEVIKLGQTRFVQVASPDYIARHGVPEMPEDLHEHATILYATIERPVGQWRFVREGENRSLRPDSVASFNHGDAITAAAVGGMGIAQTLELLVAPEIAAGRLVPVLTDWNCKAIDIQLFIRQESAKRLAVRAVADCLREKIEWPGSLQSIDNINRPGV